MNTEWHRARAASTSGLRTTWWKWGEPISSSPSATRTMFTGSFWPAPLKACRAARKVASGPFWLVAPRPIRALPTPGLSTTRASSGGDIHSDGSNCFTSYMKYMPMVTGAPASRVANTPGCPSVGIFTAVWNPASFSRSIIICAPASMLRFSAAMEGRAIQLCSRLRASGCCWSITLRKAARSGARGRAMARPGARAGDRSGTPPRAAICSRPCRRVMVGWVMVWSLLLRVTGTGCPRARPVAGHCAPGQESAALRFSLDPVSRRRKPFPTAAPGKIRPDGSRHRPRRSGPPGCP